jgi:hypothetical protein
MADSFSARARILLFAIGGSFVRALGAARSVVDNKKTFDRTDEGRRARA